MVTVKIFFNFFFILLIVFPIYPIDLKSIWIKFLTQIYHPLHDSQADCYLNTVKFVPFLKFNTWSREKKDKKENIIHCKHNCTTAPSALLSFVFSHVGVHYSGRLQDYSFIFHDYDCTSLVVIKYVLDHYLVTISCKRKHIINMFCLSSNITYIALTYVYIY